MKRSQIKNFRRKAVIALLYPLLIGLIFLFRILPIAVVRRFAVFSGKQFYRFSHRSRKVALANLKKVYGEIPEEERTKLAKQVFVESIMGFYDYMAYSHVRKVKRFFRIVDVEGGEYLRAAYKRGKGVLCLIPHLSSWEFAAITPPMLGYSTYAASKAMKSKLIENLMVKFRSRRGMKNITRKGSYKRLVQVLNEGNCLIMMTDQDTKVKGDFIDFFGIPAYTPFGVSRLQAETGAALVPMAMTRKKDGNYCFKIFPEIPPVKTDDAHLDLIENTKNQNIFYSNIIRNYPAQWVWMHRRWKTTPESLAEYLEDRKKAKVQAMGNKKKSSLMGVKAFMNVIASEKVGVTSNIR